MMSELPLKQARINEESVISETGQPSEVFTPSHLAGRYRFVREIGHGSQGKVFLAVRLSDNQRVVIKQLSIGSVKNWKEYTLFKREGEVLSGLDIDGVARFYEAPEFLEDDQPCAYIVQEYIYGETLKSRLDKGSRLTVDDVYDIAVQLLNILDKLHHHDPPVIHRDIKPSNIILEQKPGGYKVHLIDFGAVSNPQIQGGGSTVAGTYGYMPPEQLMGNPKPGSDIYALGATIVYMLGGVSPETLPNKDFRLIFEPELQHVPDDVVKTLRQMLEPNIQNRLCDCLTLKKRFWNYINHCYDLKQSDALNSFYKSDTKQYNKALCSVRHYGETGNIELWAKLSEITPRCINEPYAGKIGNMEQLKWEPVKLPDIVSTDFLIWLLIGILALLMLFPLFSIIVLFLTTKKKVSKIVGFIVTVISSILTIDYLFFENKLFLSAQHIIVLLITWISVCIIWNSETGLEHHDDKKSLSDRIDRALTEHYGLSQDLWYELKNRLISHGRKTVSKIVSVNYIPVDPRMTNEVIRMNREIDLDILNYYVWEPSKYDGKSKKGPMTPIYYGIPTFKISYAFNPPDDLRSGDIIHEFYTHQDPDEHLKPGDVLPIIYMIDHLGQPGETVYSMPFPLVLNDPVNLTDVICSSRAGR